MVWTILGAVGQGLVRGAGLEPARRKTPDPKSGASTSSAILARGPSDPGAALSGWARDGLGGVDDGI